MAYMVFRFIVRSHHHAVSRSSGSSCGNSIMKANGQTKIGRENGGGEKEIAGSLGQRGRERGKEEKREREKE